MKLWLRRDPPAVPRGAVCEEHILGKWGSGNGEHLRMVARSAPGMRSRSRASRWPATASGGGFCGASRAGLMQRYHQAATDQEQTLQRTIRRISPEIQAVRFGDDGEHVELLMPDHRVGGQLAAVLYRLDGDARQFLAGEVAQAGDLDFAGKLMPAL